MNFFQQQDVARKNTRYLLFLFMLAVAALLFLTNLFLIIFPWQLVGLSFVDTGSSYSLFCLLQTPCDFWSSIDWQRSFYCSAVVLVTIAFVSFSKWLDIRQGGKSIALMLGGTLLRVDSDKLAEKRLANVVEEMAIASNMPVPAIYVLSHEAGINAFAAGFGTHDAIIAVSQGALDNFDREQLQAVVAHEFSHILNGDMRLNMHLVAVLHGIMFISELGYLCIRGNSHSSGRNKGQGYFFLLGLGLIVLGALGTFFGTVIKAAVSRQREFLADASAVQFTRNPNGMVNALRLIGGNAAGSSLRNARAAELSHFFFAESAYGLQSLLASHPELSERILRINKYWNGKYLYKQKSATVEETDKTAANTATHANDEISQMIAAIVLAGEALADSPPKQAPMSAKRASELLHSPLGAAASICAFLLAEEPTLKAQQLQQCKQLWPELAAMLEQGDYLPSAKEDFLTILELSTSALRLFDVAQYKQLKHCLLALIKADATIDLYEWCVYSLLCSSLDNHFNLRRPVALRFNKIQEIEASFVKLLSLFVASTEQTEVQKLRAFGRACNTLGLYSVNKSQLAEPVAISDFIAAAQQLAQASPLLKARVLKALADAAKLDGQIEFMERSTLQALAALLESPLANTALIID